MLDGYQQLTIMGETENSEVVERKVLVGTVYGNLGTTWYEHEGPIEEVVEGQRKRWEEREPRHTGTEVIEVIVTRRFVVKAEVEVVEIPVSESEPTNEHSDEPSQ